jgi:hypothetical protein
MGQMGKLEPSETLRRSVLLGIRREERRRARVYLLVSGMAGSFSPVGIFFAVKYLFTVLYQSSFYGYLSLMFSDPDIVFGNFQDFAFSLAESAPLVGVTAILITVALLLLSIRVFANNLRNGLTPSLRNA